MVMRVRRTGLLALFASVLALPAAGQTAPVYPPEGIDLSGIWQFERYTQPVPGETIVPVRHVSNQKGDYTNPILQPWAAAKIKENADLIDAGTPQSNSMSRCQPLGVPRLGNIPYNFSFLQEKGVITMLYEFDHYPRFIYMNVDHPKDLQKTWMGHSVGRWEGDTLVIDTVGMNDKTWIDSVGTPHTDQLHVTERFRLTDGGKILELTYTVEDPGTFTTKWSGRSTYSRAESPMVEFVCAENNRHVESSGGDGGSDNAH
jgi:hypothetical protein